MKLLIARHGNTFAAGDKVVWTGSTNDLPLVLSGEQQAKSLAREMLTRELIPRRAYCSELSRTSSYARIVLSEMQLQLEPIVDSRLGEIDYGKWTNKTREEVNEQCDAAEQEAWDRHSIWPKNAGWTSTEQKVISEIHQFCTEQVDQNDPESIVFLVSSNGKIRYFLKLIEGAFERAVEQNNFKVKTGAYCLLEFCDNKWQIKDWNKVPDYCKR